MRFRTKIVLWYGAIVLVTLFAFRLASIGLIRELLFDDLDESLRAEATWVERLVRDQRARGIPDAEIVEEVAERSRLAPRKEYIEVRRPGGDVLFRSPNLEDASLRPLARPPLGEPSEARLRDTPVRVLVTGTPDLQVVVAYPVTDTEQVIESLVDSFLYLIPLAIALAAVGGFFLASRFLRPVEAMERYAERAIALPLDRDLPPPPAGSADEIGRLLARIHEVVERLRENHKRAIGFSSLASHELRTPLAVLRSQMEDALRPDASEEELRSVLASTYDEVLRLGSVVEGLLDLSTLHSRTLRLDRIPLEIASFLAVFAEEVGPLCESNEVRLRLGRTDEVVFDGDPSRLRQVLFNLVDNALKHIEPGGVVSLEAVAGDDHATVIVEDDGSGIPEAALARVFDPFYRAPEGSAGGTGLGLALVRWIVEAHGGAIEIRSRREEGTRVELRLPRAGRGTSPDGPAPSPAPGKRG